MFSVLDVFVGAELEINELGGVPNITTAKVTTTNN